MIQGIPASHGFNSRRFTTRRFLRGSDSIVLIGSRRMIFCNLIIVIMVIYLISWIPDGSEGAAEPMVHAGFTSRRFSFPPKIRGNRGLPVDKRNDLIHFCTYAYHFTPKCKLEGRSSESTNSIDTIFAIFQSQICSNLPKVLSIV